MRAVLYDRYGPPGVLALREVAEPGAGPGQLVVRVHASSVNAMDWYALTGTPYVFRLATGLSRPKPTIAGTDFAGTVAAVGDGVHDLRPGDAVFGTAAGAFAESVCASADRVAALPAGVPFEDAAAVPVAGLTALQGLRDHGRLRPGEHVLVHGASGGVGSLAVAIAKALGARVTAVCAAARADAIRALGADEVLDTAGLDFARLGPRFDVFLDIAGTRPLGACRRALRPGARFVIAGGPRRNRWLGPLPHFGAAMLAGALARPRATPFVSHANRADLGTLGAMLASGAVRPAIDARYPLERAAEAFDRFDAGGLVGKVVVTVRGGDGG